MLHTRVHTYQRFNRVVKRCARAPESAELRVAHHGAGGVARLATHPYINVLRTSV